MTFCRARNLAGRVHQWLIAKHPNDVRGTEFAWKESLRLFFEQRAGAIASKPTLEDLCFVSGRDPRVWTDPVRLEELTESILVRVASGATGSLIEVGCASGFVARLVAPRVARYTGIDVSHQALAVARRLGLANAEFQVADGTLLPYSNDAFDGGLCYEVFINLPRFEHGARIIAEMLRVVRPGGRVLVGSVPDAARESAYAGRIAEVTLDLERQHGPAKLRPQPAAANSEARSELGAAVLCYFFRKQDFLALGTRLGTATQILDVHRLNPYFGYRYDVVYTKPRQ